MYQGIPSLIIGVYTDFDVSGHTPTRDITYPYKFAIKRNSDS